MLITTRAIVIAIKRRTDTTSWVDMYTELHGSLRFLLYGHRHRPLFTPLALVEVTADMPSTGAIPSIRTAAMVYAPQRLPNDAKLRCIALFMSEVLSLTLRLPMQDTPLFTWLWQQVIELDTSDEYINKHISFMQAYTYMLGIGLDVETHAALLMTPVTRQERQVLLKQLCSYYEEHIDDFTSPKSLDVLMEVFND